MNNDAVTRDGACYFPDDADAAAKFDLLADELGGTETLRPQQAMMLADLVRSEDLKERLRTDIVTRGVGGEVWNGRQRYFKENKSVTTYMKLMELQRRTMQTLGLIAKDTNQPKGDEDEDDGFDRF